MESTTPNFPGRTAGPGWLAGAGLLAAGAVWLVTWKWHPFFLHGVQVVLGVRPSDEDIAAVNEANLYNVLAVFGLLGGTLGAAFASATAIRHRSVRLVLWGIPSGLVLGAACGMLGGWCAAMVAETLGQTAFMPHKYRHFNPTIARACGWGLLGLGAGLGFSLPLGNRRAVAQATLGALVGGLLAAPCYQAVIGIIGMFAQVSGAEEVVADEPLARAVWLGMAGVFIGLAAGLASSTSRRGEVEGVRS
jgi:hypothetical protein